LTIIDIKTKIDRVLAVENSIWVMLGRDREISMAFHRCSMSSYPYLLLPLWARHFSLDTRLGLYYNIDTIERRGCQQRLRAGCNGRAGLPEERASMLQISINQSEGTALYLQLVRQLRYLIATRRLAPGDELPPVRVLAQQLVINPNTVVRAYRELEAAGLIYTRRGAGTYVSDRPVPYSDGERRRILSERLDTVVVESRNLGYSLEEVVELLRERDRALRIESGLDGQKEEEQHGKP